MSDPISAAHECSLPSSREQNVAALSQGTVRHFTAFHTSDFYIV